MARSLYKTEITPVKLTGAYHSLKKQLRLEASGHIVVGHYFEGHVTTLFYSKAETK